MRIHHVERLIAAGLVLALCGCSDTGLFSIGGKGPGRPDRALFDGQVCIPPATGDAFPVKVLFAIQGGAGVDVEIVNQVVDALSSGLFNVASMSFSLVAYHTIATGLQGSFVSINDLQQPLTRFASYQEQGPVSLRAPLELANTIISGDMLSGCPGSVARTRYIVVLVVASGDTTCNNPGLNNLPTDPEKEPCLKLLDPALPPGFAQPACASCVLAKSTTGVMDLVDRYGAGQVVVQPIYVRNTIDYNVAAEVAAIAKAGGSSPVQVTPSGLSNAIAGLNYASLQRQLTIKRVLAFNRNARVREGKLLVDSDGDGLSDDDEKNLFHTDPLKPDTDGDRLMDGIEVKMGLDPLVPDTINGCNPEADEDGDRLDDCEERVLGTQACVGDTDGDGLPDLVEVLSGTNPLVPEDLQDADGDGMINVEEVVAHSDPNSGDNGFRVDFGYGYTLTPDQPTADGRACFHVRVSNVGLVPTVQRPNPPFGDIAAGNNDIYLYVQSGRENDPHGAGISGLQVQQVTLTPQHTRVPEGQITLRPEDFTLGL